MTQVAPIRPKLNSQQVAYAGEHYVAAEIHRRGGYAVTFSGNMKGIDLLASDAQHDRVIKIQVKTKTRGTWQTTIRNGRKWTKPPQNVDRYWVLVDLGQDSPEFYIAPAWWMENGIYTHHQQYLADSGGHRRTNDDSTHHAIPQQRIAKWKDKWDELGIFPTAEPLPGVD
jgi:hypothetical protein